MSKAAFQRALKGATHVMVTNERYPELSGVREVVKVQTNAVSLRLPEDHPRYDEVVGGSWTYFDTADRAEGDEYVHVDALTGAVIARFKVVPAYEHTHVSVRDGSPAMFVRFVPGTHNTAVYMNECGDTWEDLASYWDPIVQ